MLIRFAIAAAALVAAPMALADDEIVGDIDRGADAYDASCVECHARPGRFMQGIEGDDEERAAWLDEFLVEHYAEDDQDRADIIAYLLDL